MVVKTMMNLVLIEFLTKVLQRLMIFFQYFGQPKKVYLNLLYLKLVSKQLSS